MIWMLLIFSLGLVTARRHAEPEYLDQLRAEGKDEEFAELMGIDVKLARPRNEGRSEGSMMNMVSALGDILLTADKEEQVRQGIDFNKYPGNRWPNNEIPYVISRSDYSPEQIKVIESAITDFNSKVTNMQLVRRRNFWNRQKDYVMIYSGDGCYSYLGRIGGQQALSLQSNGCIYKAIVQHEFMHATGFTHEHNRPDRDDNIRIIWENIPSEWRSQYQKVSSDIFAIQRLYDYYSIMHYPVGAPDTDDKPAFEVLTPSIQEEWIGNADTLTDIDIDKLDELYSSKL